jgi:hypothetical protein
VVAVPISDAFGVAVAQVEAVALNLDVGKTGLKKKGKKKRGGGARKNVTKVPTRERGRSASSRRKERA